MADIMFRKQQNKSLQLVSDIVFEGALLSDTRAVLVTELIFYILYEREQIPLPVDHLRIRTEAFKQDTSVQRQVNKVTDRRASLFLEDLKQLCDNLKRSFRSCPEIDQVSIHLGGTVVSPKESYVVKFPPTCPDADYLPLGSCKNTLFKQIISEDLLGSIKSPLSPANITLLVSAPRSCPLTWFLPKHSISPKSGTNVLFNFHCLYFVPICHDLSIYDCDSTDISGLEALDCTLCDSEKQQSSDYGVSNGTGIDDDTQKSEAMKCHNEKLSHDSFPETSDSSMAACNNESSDRFCKHKRLNYIFSTHKRKERPVVDSPWGSPLPDSISSALHMNNNPCSNDVKDNPCSGKKFTHDMSTAHVDSILYQSPVTLKGFKDPVDPSFKL